MAEVCLFKSADEEASNGSGSVNQPGHWDLAGTRTTEDNFRIYIFVITLYNATAGVYYNSQVNINSSKFHCRTLYIRMFPRYICCKLDFSCLRRKLFEKLGFNFVSVLENIEIFAD